jgi:hypothetical protein
MPDHFTDQLAPLPALTAAAMATSTLRVGALVWDNDYKHPIVLAKEVSVFQLEFWDPRKGEYAPEWLVTNQLPLVVRVTLGFGSTGRFAKQPAQLVTRVVRIPSSTVSPVAQGGVPTGN